MTGTFSGQGVSRGGDVICAAPATFPLQPTHAIPAQGPRRRPAAVPALPSCRPGGGAHHGRDFMGKKFYITTAIDYTNGPPHIGHAYEKVLADAMARFVRLTGREVYFLTGVDQHGRGSRVRPQSGGAAAGLEREALEPRGRYLVRRPGIVRIDQEDDSGLVSEQPGERKTAPEVAETDRGTGRRPDPEHASRPAGRARRAFPRRVGSRIQQRQPFGAVRTHTSAS